MLNAKAAAALVVRVASHGGSAKNATATVDGRPVQVTIEGNTIDVTPGALPDGPHTIVVRAGGAKLTRTFTVDATPPALTVAAPPTAPSLRSPVTLTGTVDGATKVEAGTQVVPVTGGHFSVTVPTPPAALKVRAFDAAGNVAVKVVSVSVLHPLMRGVHLTGYGWNADFLRDPVLRLARQHRINTVELDVKEEDGYVDFNTKVNLAHRIGGVRVLYDPRKVIPLLHKMGVRVVGRIVCFRDPKLAAWAWVHHHRDWDVQAPGGKAPYKSAKYGGAAFTNWASPAVQAYNIALATEAAKLGFDDVMFDYVRRPDGPLNTMRFPGAGRTTAPVGVANFVRDASGPVRAGGGYLGLAVFGVSATRPKEVGQDIGAMARYVDYVAPMVYPSHWGPGEYGVGNPNAQPYAIVNRSLKDFQKKVAGTTAQVMPWLQDFSLGVHYGVPQVAAQILAARADHIGSFLLWNAGCVYQGAALAVDRKMPRTTD
ncbi:MAG: hypothetical protein QOG34_1514 [Frankiaceae bacterium]|nr:hypothetical protein [Frankiaceae bacterium]